MIESKLKFIDYLKLLRAGKKITCFICKAEKVIFKVEGADERAVYYKCSSCGMTVIYQGA